MSIRLPTHSLFAFNRISFLTNLPERFALFTVLTLIAIFSRLFLVGTLPVAVTHDEIFYANQAKSLSFSGVDHTGAWEPSDFTSSHSLFAEWPGVVITPGFILFPDNPLVASRFSSAILGGLLPLILSCIAWQLFAKRKISLIVFLLAMVNPWMFQVSRHGFDVLFTLFFYLSGILVLLSAKDWLKLSAAPFFFIGFFQYQAGKVLLVPLIILIAGYMILKAKKYPATLSKAGCNALQLTTILGFILVGWFAITLSSQAASSRLNDIALFDTAVLTEQVDTARAGSVLTPVTSLVFNKATILVSNLSLEFVKSIDLQQFFLKGEPLRNPTTIWSHSIFYLVDAVLIVLGMMLLFVDKRWRYQSWLLALLTLVAFIPQVINTKDTWIFLRLGLLYPILLLYASLGFYYIWKHFRPIYLFRPLLLGVYTLSAGYFGYHLFFVSPVIATTDIYFAERVLASYVERASADQKEVLVLADQSRFIFEEILFYNTLITKENAAQIADSIQNETYVVQNIAVDTNCFPGFEAGVTTIVDNSVASCIPGTDESNQIELLTESPEFVIRSPYSGTEIFTIKNDSLCNQNSATSTPEINYQTVQVESLSNEAFCQTYIVAK